MRDTKDTILDEKTKIELRRVQIDLLDHLDAICKKHNITYWLDFASLLGAYRYKAFMPVDDDIDVSIAPNDYERFLKIAQSELPSNIFLQTNETDKQYTECYAKFRHMDSTFLEKGNKNVGSYYGIYIDIFPSYEYPKLPTKLFKALLYVTGRSRARAYTERKRVILNKTIYLSCKLIWFILKPFGAKLYGQTPEDNWYFYAIPSRLLFPLGKIEFQGKDYPAPAKPYEYLLAMYGKRCMEDMPMEEQISKVHSDKIYPNMSYEEYCKHKNVSI